jgi:CelD/BcsL family acetyltransferase involved in cellulose biosynthesis
MHNTPTLTFVPVDAAVGPAGSAGSSGVVPLPVERHPPVQGLVVSLAQLPLPRQTAAFAAAVAALQVQWTALSAQAQGSFFTSWSWIGCWLAGLPADTQVHVLRATDGPQTVGLAVLVRGPWRRLGGVPVVPVWHLHATGRAEMDALCIEHNGLLVDARCAGQVEPAMLAHWWQVTRGARELSLPSLPGKGLPPAWMTDLLARHVLLECEVRERISYTVHLDAVRQAGGDCLALLSGNLRSQIRRTMKAYAEVGELTLEAAQGPAEALAYLDRLIELHQARWESRGLPGAFASTWFTDFHRRLVQQEADTGRLQLLRLRAGDQDVAYLYSFVYQGRVCFYQSGLNYELGGKHGRPGYAAHVLAINLNARLGLAVYDFLVGDARYKQDLANVEEPMSDVVLRTPSWRFAAERTARGWARRGKAALRGDAAAGGENGADPAPGASPP